MYSMTWMKSTMIGMVIFRAFASARIRSIWWELPSTRAIQVRAWSGSRRSASANPAAITAAASSVTEACSHLPEVTGAGVGFWAALGSSGRMSAIVRGAGATSKTAATSHMRLRLRYSPLERRAASFWPTAALAVPARSPSGRITTPLASNDNANTSSSADQSGAWAV
jgi:hypothetical protein